MKIKKLSALILAGALACTTPAAVFADNTSDTVDQAVQVLEDSGVDEMLSDPDKVADIIIAAQDAVGQADVSDDTLKTAITTAAEELGVTLTDSETDTLIQLYNKFKDMNLDKDKLRTTVSQVYDKLESLGVTKDDVKGILGKLINVVKGILN